jgi:Bacterial protein of unknown function (DUF937)
MSTNLVSSVMQYLTPDVIAKFAPTLGIDANTAQKAIGVGVPTVLAMFAKLAGTPEGAQQLSDTIKQQNPGFLGQIANAVGGSGQKAMTDTGSSLLSSLLGGNGMNTLVSALSSFCGINQSAGKSMLGLLGPIAVGALGQEQRKGGLGAGGVADLLSAQKDQITAAMPSGLASMLGATSLFDAGGMAGAAENAAGRAADYLAPRASVAAAAARNTSASSWPYWLAGLFVVAGLGWYLHGRSNPQLIAQNQPLQTQMPESSDGQMATRAAANLSADLTSSVENVRSTLQGINDPASARAALPKLQEATDQLDKIKGLASQLPPGARKGLVLLLGSWMPVLNQLCDRVLSRPEVANVAQPTIEALRTKLEVLAQT